MIIYFSIQTNAFYFLFLSVPVFQINGLEYLVFSYFGKHKACVVLFSCLKSQQLKLVGAFGSLAKRKGREKG